MIVRFIYSVIRYVGDPVRGEGTNVGVVVIAPDGDARVQTDPTAMRRLMRFWPLFNRRAVREFIRDIEHRVAAMHQLRIEEADQSAQTDPAAVLADLSDLAVNEIQFSPPAFYRSPDIEQATRSLFNRFVWVSGEPQTKGRYLTRAMLRDMITGVLAEWSFSQNLSVESDTEIDGKFAPHKVDVVVRRGDDPELVVLALPLRSKDAPLIRDSLPGKITDLRGVIPKAQFLAILSDPSGENTARIPENLDVEKTRQFLDSSIENLDILPVSDLLDHIRRNYAGNQMPPIAFQGKLTPPVR